MTTIPTPSEARAAADAVVDRIEAIEQRLGRLESVRDERDHWIGEAKRYERLYGFKDETATRWWRKLQDANARLVKLGEEPV